MPNPIHRYAIHSTCSLVLILVVYTEAPAQFLINLNGGNVNMTLSSGAAGGQLINVVSTTASLTYWRPLVLSKITVSTVCIGQSFNLQVVATSATAGVAQTAVSLINGNPAMDFIRDIPRTGSLYATCILQYTASATFAQGNSAELSNDVHTVTYTFQSQ
jgi:hypothetical protein